MDVAQVVDQLGRRSQGLVTKAQLVRAQVSEGALFRALVAGEVVRVHRAVYATSLLPPRPRHLVTDRGVAPAYVAHVRAALLSLGPSAVASGRTAAALRCWELLVEPTRRIDVAVPHGRSTVALTAVDAQQRRSLEVEQLVVLPGTEPLWVTAPAQTVVDGALRLPTLQAVVLCDSALRCGAVSEDELVRRCGALPGQRQARRLGEVIALSDARAESVLESVQRVRMLLGGVTGMEPQVVVRAEPLVRVDFAHRRARVVVEVDGRRWHPDPARDQARDNLLAALGWRVLRFTWAEVVHDPARVLLRVQQAVAAGGTGFQLAG